VKESKGVICDPQHYTIYEKFQDIEHPLAGDELIYELWQNWGENKQQVQFKLKINKELEKQRKEENRVKAKDKVRNYNGFLIKLKISHCD
jgi:hypothetical protein